jgi:hypothetical protein
MDLESLATTLMGIADPNTAFEATDFMNIKFSWETAQVSIEIKESWPGSFRLLDSEL